MTLNLTPEEKAQREKLYKKEYSKQYYREQKAENNERYKDILDKARNRYHAKKETVADDSGNHIINSGNTRKYRKRNILNV
jgi:hypothetical protein